MIPANHTIRLIDIKDTIPIQDVLTNYEIFDSNYRNTLNNKILDHYAYEEIGLETPALFAHYLKVRLNEIMPKYNMLYNSELLKLDPLGNYSMTETYENENTSSSEGETNSESDSTSRVTSQSTSTDTNNTTNTSSETIETENSSSGSNVNNGGSSSNDIKKNVYQNTPQGQLIAESITNYTYATNQTLEGNNNTQTHNDTTNTTDESSGTTTNSGTNTINSTKTNTTNDTDNTVRNSTNTATNTNTAESTSNYIRKIVGNKGINNISLFKQFVDSFISIDKLIIDELSDLFMGIY